MKKIYLLLLAAITLASCSVERRPEYMMDEEAITQNIDESFPALLKGCYGYLKNVVGPHVSLWRICRRQYDDSRYIHRCFLRIYIVFAYTK